MKLLFIVILFGVAKITSGQLIINDAKVVLSNGAKIVINNQSSSAISRLGTGYISSEGKGNLVIWNIGSGDGNIYTIPFGNSSYYLPVSFAPLSGSGEGYFIFSTYATSSWKNSDELPPGVTNIDAGGNDNSEKVIDRFWQIEPKGYATNPNLNNLVITYSDSDYRTPNTITETAMMPQRWNNVNGTWNDFLPSGIVNTVAKTITIASIPGNQLYDWWTLVDASSPLPLTLVNFNASVRDSKVNTNWQTLSEQNTKAFEIWRSKDLIHSDSIGWMAAAGNSSGLINYHFTDETPYFGISYYRLKSLDLNGRFTWSKWVRVILENNIQFAIYPNPSHDFLNLSVSSDIANDKPMAFIYDIRGSKVYTFTISNTLQQINISMLPAGTYQIRILHKEKNYSIPFIKK